MNLTIIKAFFRAVSVLVISLSSFVNSDAINTRLIGVQNIDKNKSSNEVSTKIDYETIVTYNSKIPSGVIKKIKPGMNGLVALDKNGKVLKTIIEKQDEIIQIGTGKYGMYNGTLTAYGADCPGCTGVLGCPNKAGKPVDLYKTGITYSDLDYGKVRILAADFREFPCGTIIEVSNSNYKKPFYGIVLDTGYAMRKAYNNGRIVIDLAFMKEYNPSFKTNYNTTFSVQRWGW